MCFYPHIAAIEFLKLPMLSFIIEIIIFWLGLARARPRLFNRKSVINPHVVQISALLSHGTSATIRVAAQADARRMAVGHVNEG